MTRRTLTPLALALLLAAPGPTEASDRGLAIVGGRVNTMIGPPIPGGVVLVRDGIIQGVGDAALQVPRGYRVVDAKGVNVLPGLIDAGTRLGLVEVPMEAKAKETGKVKEPDAGHLRMIDGFHPASTLIPVSRLTGVTTALVSPGGQSVLAGQAAIVDLAGDRRQDMIVAGASLLRINLGGVQAAGKDSGTLSTRMGRVAFVRGAFLAAQEYARKLERHEKELAHFRAEQAHDAKVGGAGGTGDGSSGGGGTGTGSGGDEDEEDDFPPLKLPPEPPARDLRKEALVEALQRERKVLVRAHRADDIRAALRLGETFGLDLVVVHGTEAWKVADELADRDVPVILGPVNTQPDSFETLGARYDNAALLYKAGVRLALQTADSHNVRNLPYMAGLAVAHGLPRVEALAACTIESARILGIDERYGSIEIDKVANLVLVQGDVFQPRSRVRGLVIRGEEVPLTSRQTVLAARYRTRPKK